MSEFTGEVMDKLVKLEDICKDLFGITPKIARRKAALGKLPVKAFRLSGSRKGPLYVLKDDVREYIESRGLKKAV